VTYQSEFVTYDGALWQARKDTVTTPGGAAWLCVARAGRDAVTPTVRGKFDAHMKYKELDIIAIDGGTFIARRNNPGIPGDGNGWQTARRQ